MRAVSCSLDAAPASGGLVACAAAHAAAPAMPTPSASALNVQVPSCRLRNHRHARSTEHVSLPPPVRGRGGRPPICRDAAFATVAPRSRRSRRSRLCGMPLRGEAGKRSVNRCARMCAQLAVVAGGGLLGSVRISREGVAGAIACEAPRPRRLQARAFSHPKPALSIPPCPPDPLPPSPSPPWQRALPGCPPNITRGLALQATTDERIACDEACALLRKVWA